MLTIIIVLFLNLALFTNSLAQEPPPEIYQNHTSPFTLNNNYYHLQHNITRPLLLNSPTALYTTTPSSPTNPQSPVAINGSIGATSMFNMDIYKLGPGHLQLNGNNSYSGDTYLLEGSLGLGHNNALGDEFNQLWLYAGTALVLNPSSHSGLTINNDIVLFNGPQPPLPAGWGQINSSHAPVNIYVSPGQASLNGWLTGNGSINKLGAGALNIDGYSFSQAPMQLLQGSVYINGLWSGVITSQSHTLIGGNGMVGAVQLAGALRPGSASQTGTIYTDSLSMSNSASLVTRINSPTDYDSIVSYGNAELNGQLQIQAQGLPQGRYTIVSANNLNHSRFSSISSNTPAYISPVLSYNDSTSCQTLQACQSVELSFAYNRLGLNHAEPNWLAATVLDSRFIRETAIDHTASGKAWARSWFANSEWHNTERDTSGLQLGNSFSLSPNSQLAIYAGVQNSHWRQGHQIRNQSWYAGLGWGQTMGPLQLSLGHIYSKHKGKISRNADINEPSINSTPRAHSQQSWLYLSTTNSLALAGSFSLKPFAEINHTYTKRQAYSESGNPAAISAQSQSYHHTAGRLGLQINNQWPTQYGNAIFTSSIAVNQNFNHSTINSAQSYKASGDSFKVSSLALPKTSFRLDLGVNADIAKHTKIHLAYTGSHSSKQKQHGVWGGVQVVF